MQSGGKEAVPNSSESAGLTEQVGGVGSDNSEPATCSHQHTVPQTQPQTHNSAHELLTDPGSHVVDSSTMPALDMPLGSSAGGGGGGGSGSSHNGSTGMAATSSPGVCGPGATATSTRLEPVISPHYSQEGQCSVCHVSAVMDCLYQFEQKTCFLFDFFGSWGWGWERMGWDGGLWGVRV